MRAAGNRLICPLARSRRRQQLSKGTLRMQQPARCSRKRGSCRGMKHSHAVGSGVSLEVGGCGGSRSQSCCIPNSALPLSSCFQRALQAGRWSIIPVLALGSEDRRSKACPELCCPSATAGAPFRSRLALSVTHCPISFFFKNSSNLGTGLSCQQAAYAPDVSCKRASLTSSPYDGFACSW